MSRYLRFVPLALLAVFLSFVAWRLTVPSDTTIRSKLEGKPIPAFALSAAIPGRASFGSADLATGRPVESDVQSALQVQRVVEAVYESSANGRSVSLEP